MPLIQVNDGAANRRGNMSETLTPDDLTAIKEKQHATWSSGDYAVIGTTLQLIGEQLCEAIDLSAGWKVLDVAAGNGSAALAAARRGCEVIATDYVEGLLDRARCRADADGFALTTKVAGACQRVTPTRPLDDSRSPTRARPNLSRPRAPLGNSTSMTEPTTTSSTPSPTSSGSCGRDGRPALWSCDR
jgi:hypothetical protein